MNIFIDFIFIKKHGYVQFNKLEVRGHLKLNYG